MKLIFATRGALVVALTLLTAIPLATGQQTPAGDATPAPRWYKGNTHTHTLNSDGDSTPDEVVRWYRENGYHFLVLSDHNFLTSVEGLNAIHGAGGKFVLIPGEEVTDRFGDKPIHVNGLNLRELVTPQGGTSVVDTLQRNVNAVRRVQGVPHVNHPNFQWALTAEGLARVENTRLFEIYNGHPHVNNTGGGGRPGLEEMWDIILTTGKLLYGIAVDDAYHFKQPWNPRAARPGHGWVVVRAAQLTAEAILTAMERGDFYASTGVALRDIQVTPESMTITIQEDGATKYTVQFIGRGGAVLETAVASPAVYRFRGDELYVRAKVADSNGKAAWVQPVFPRAPRKD